MIAKRNYPGFFSVLKGILAVIVLAIFTIFGVSSHQNRNERRSIINLMAGFQYVNRILVITCTGSLDISEDDCNFEFVKTYFYPFYPGRVGIPRNTRQSLTALSQGRFASITYFTDGQELFSAYIYTFYIHPSFTDDVANICGNVFMIDNLYGVVFIGETDFLGRFGFEEMDTNFLTALY